jgi:shikimate kinase
MKLLLDERRPLYLEVADIVVETDGKDAEQVAAEVDREVSAYRSAGERDG